MARLFIEIMKYLLVFDSLRLNNSLGFTVKENVTNTLTRRGDKFTFLTNDDYDAVIAGSGEDLFAKYSSLKPNKPIYVFADADSNDVAINTRGKENNIILSQTAFNYYQKATKLLVAFDSQIDFLKSHGIKTPIVRINLDPTFLKTDHLFDYERTAFRSFYQIPLDDQLIVSYGSYSDKKEFSALESIAGVSPDKEYIFFGHNDREFVKMKMMERLVKADNIKYLETMPEELYHSALLNIDALLFTQKFIPYPNIIIDAIYYKIPIIAYHTDSLPRVINEKTALVPKDFQGLYDALKNIKTNNRSEAAYNLLFPKK